MGHAEIISILADVVRTGLAVLALARGANGGKEPHGGISSNGKAEESRRVARQSLRPVESGTSFEPACHRGCLAHDARVATAQCHLRRVCSSRCGWMFFGREPGSRPHLRWTPRNGTGEGVGRIGCWWKRGMAFAFHPAPGNPAATGGSHGPLEPRHPGTGSYARPRGLRAGDHRHAVLAVCPALRWRRHLARRQRHAAHGRRCGDHVRDHERGRVRLGRPHRRHQPGWELSSTTRQMLQGRPASAGLFAFRGHTPLTPATGRVRRLPGAGAVPGSCSAQFRCRVRPLIYQRFLTDG